MYIIFFSMKLRYLLLSVTSLGLILAVPHIKTATQSLVGGSPNSSTAVPSQQPDQPKTETELANEMFQRVNPTVVTVLSGREIGSGSIVRADGWVLTAKHVVWGAPEITVKTLDGKTYSASLRAIDPQYDLALLKLDTKDSLPTITLASNPKLRPGQKVYAIGSPAGKAGTFTTGTFTKVNQYGSLQTSKGLLEPGNSGGPLLNLQGEMIGVNKGLLKDGSGLATSITSAKTLIERSQKIHRVQ